MSVHRQAVLSQYRQLLKLIQRLPGDQRVARFQEATSTLKERKDCSHPETRLAYLKELAAKIGYLKIITPRRPSDAEQAPGTYVLRDGQLVPGEGSTAGSRVATGTITMDEAMQKNRQHFKKFYGADKPKSMFF